MSGDAISTLEDFLARIEEHKRSRSREEKVLVYRGVWDEGWDFLPSAFRKANSEHEHERLEELVALQPHEFSSDTTAVEKLSRAQHYGVPTRLMDVTWNPLVALFFAVSEDPMGGKPNEGESPPVGAVEVIEVDQDLVNYWNSHTVACIANLVHLSAKRRDALRDVAAEYRGRTDDDAVIDDFKEKPVAKRLVDVIREEKPYFEHRVDPRDLFKVLCVKPKLSSGRIIAQAGAFLLWGFEEELTRIDGIERVDRILIASDAKSGLRDRLDHLAIHTGNLFPEIDKVASWINHRGKGTK